MGLYNPMEIPCLKSAVALAVASFAVFVSFGGVACDGSAIRLLDGRTLDDFESIPCLPKGEIAKAYSISNGMMRASGEIDALLVTRDTYSDFDLSFDVCYPEDGFGDGGISLFVRTLPERTDVYTGLEIQTKTGDLGDIWGLPRFVISRDAETPPPKGRMNVRIGEVFRRMPRFKDVPHIPGRWMHVDFKRKGLDCELKIDGILVNRCRLEVSCEGRIGFQTKPYPQGKAPVLYRNMFLTPVKSAK